MGVKGWLLGKDAGDVEEGLAARLAEMPHLCLSSSCVSPSCHLLRLGLQDVILWLKQAHARGRGICPRADLLMWHWAMVACSCIQCCCHPFYLVKVSVFLPENLFPLQDCCTFSG